MFEFQLEPLELIYRAVIVYFFLLIMVRLTGRRTLGQFTAFDLLVVMLISAAVEPSMTGGDESLYGGLLVCFVLILLNTLVGFIVAKSRSAEKIIEGEAVLLGRDGTVYERIRVKHRVSINDIDSALREAECKAKEFRALYLEASGHITVVKE
ncbi:DUF421 domain-containing protein [Comamonas sp. NoAH]|uniref:DUF421 domain-containing protein n=1 Tax=Comamonas halotolerans TaxID=3041496 RepID=UPI0024E0F3C4|nr:YetF domain-containing protein [Comamonas sp. NoAH]